MVGRDIWVHHKATELGGFELEASTYQGVTSTQDYIESSGGKAKWTVAEKHAGNTRCIKTYPKLEQFII